MSVMLQAFYWDSPAKENKVGEWWTVIAEKLESLKAAGLIPCGYRRCQRRQASRRWATTHMTISILAISIRKAE